MRVFLADPDGFNHIVEFDGGQVHGAENIANAFPNDPPQVREDLTRELLELMTRFHSGKHEGYRWQRL